MYPCTDASKRLSRWIRTLFRTSLLCSALFAAILAGSTASAWELKSYAYHTCVIDDIGVACWGAGEATDPSTGNNYGQSIVPTNLVNPFAVDVGTYHTCAIDDIGVACWGAGESIVPATVHYGQSMVPPGLGLLNPRAIAAGGFHTCVIDDSPEKVTCWGRGTEGQTTVPPGLGLLNPRAIAAGKFHTCVLDDSTAKVTCWGAVNHDALTADYGQTTVPPGLINPTEISAGRLHTCVVDGSTDGVTCWGDGLNAAPGQSHVATGMVQPFAIATGFFHSCALWSIWSTCWGTSNPDYGQSPPLVRWTNPTIIAAGGYHSCVLDDNGVTCWGRGEGGADDGESTVPLGLVFVPEPSLALLQFAAMLSIGTIAHRKKRKV